MPENNPYAAPQSTVDTPPPSHVGGSIEKALAGDSNWRIGDILNEAWEKQNGFKGTFWGAFVIYYAILIVANMVAGSLFGSTGEAGGAGLAQLIIMLITYPMVAGLMVMGIRRAANLPVRTMMVFDYYHKILPIFGQYILMAILVTIGFILLVLPGIYLVIAYGLALPLLVEKQLGVWEALETSRKGITKCWFRYFGLVLLMGLIVMVSAIPLLIGLIWTLPMGLLVVGIVYRDMYGVGVPEDPAAQQTA